MGLRSRHTARSTIALASRSSSLVAPPNGSATETTSTERTLTTETSPRTATISRPFYPGRSQQQQSLDYLGREQPADLDGGSPIVLDRLQQLDDSRQQGEPLPTEIDAEAEEAPEDSNGNDQDDPNDNINRDGHISDDDQEDDSQAADSQPDDEYYDSKKTAKRAKRTPNKVMQLKRKGRLHKPRLAKKQRGNVNH
ncbi:hypothetical protein AAVH_14510 [Aphelenchoides avenae]|nr:hypothetical protein AAVH_14510 [Aphelenchus avenae]